MNRARNRDRALYEGLAGAGLVFLAAAVIGKTAGIIRPDIAQLAAGCGFSVAAMSGCLLRSFGSSAVWNTRIRGTSCSQRRRSCSSC